MVVTVLTTENHNLEFQVMDEQISGNLMFIWHIFAHWAIFLHIPAAVCALVFKQFLNLKDNIFHPDHTTQLKKPSIDSRLVGANARSYDSKWGDSVSQGLRYFTCLHRHIACILSCARKPSQLKNFLLRVINQVLKVYDPTASVASSSMSSTKNKRLQLVKDAGLINGRLLTALDDEYLDGLPNMGNPLANYAASSDDIDNNSKTLARAAKSGDWFCCQTDVVDVPNQSQRKAGE